MRVDPRRHATDHIQNRLPTNGARATIRLPTALKMSPMSLAIVGPLACTQRMNCSKPPLETHLANALTMS